MKKEMYVVRTTMGQETAWEKKKWVKNLAICADEEDAYMFVKQYVENNSVAGVAEVQPFGLESQKVSFDPIDADWAYIEVERLPIWREED